MRVLITGGSGFVGSHVARRFLAQGLGVRILDLQPPAISHPRLDFVHGDVRDFAKVLNCLDGVDSVFHFAAKVSVPWCEANAAEGFSHNLGGTAAVVSALIAKNSQHAGQPTRLIFASSSAVYGDVGGPEYRQREGEPLPQPASFYAAQKRASEELIRDMYAMYTVPALSFRFFNVYGPGQADDSPYSGVISRFRRDILSGAGVRIFGDGTQSRDFIAVEDIAEACSQALVADPCRLRGQAVNLGSGQSISIAQLASEMFLVSGREVSIKFMERRPGDILHSCAEISAAKDLLGWTPQRELRLGIKSLFEIN
jgi:nucleoside-diphosphate-sugar epimerase